MDELYYIYPMETFQENNLEEKHTKDRLSFDELSARMKLCYEDYIEDVIPSIQQVHHNMNTLYEILKHNFYDIYEITDLHIVRFEPSQTSNTMIMSLISHYTIRYYETIMNLYNTPSKKKNETNSIYNYI
jgi:hypothetical protein